MKLEPRGLRAWAKSMSGSARRACGNRDDDVIGNAVITAARTHTATF